MLAEPEIIIRNATQIAAMNANRHDTARNPFAAMPPRPVLTIAQIDERRREIDERNHLQRAHDLWRKSSVPIRYQSARLTDLDHVPADAHQRYSAALAELVKVFDTPAIIALLGPRGTGKTHMSCAIVRESCKRVITAKYLTAADYFGTLKATYDDKASTSESNVEQTYANCKLLVLDEMHERGNTDWEATKLTRLVDKRYSAGVATILISNLTPAEFATHAGSSITDRIRDGGKFIVCDWQSLRGRIEQHESKPLQAEQVRIDR